MNKLLVLIGLVLLQGCASIGNSEFSCSGIPDGTRCEKTSSLYNEVDNVNYGYSDQKSNDEFNGNLKSRIRLESSRNTIGRNYSGDVYSEFDNRSGKSGEQFFGKIPTVSGGSPDQLMVINPPLADKTQPQRMGAKMRRVWIAPWVDRDDVYHGDQLLYVDIEAEHWVNGEKSTSLNPIFNPLK